MRRIPFGSTIYPFVDSFVVMVRPSCQIGSGLASSPFSLLLRSLRAPFRALNPRATNDERDARPPRGALIAAQPSKRATRVLFVPRHKWPCLRPAPFH